MFATRSRAGGAQRCLRVWLAGGGAGFALLLGSCSAPVGHTATPPSPKELIASSAKPTPSIANLAEDGGIHSHTRDGAAAFVDLYYQMSNAAIHSLQVDKLINLSMSSCTCRKFAWYLQREIAPTGHLSGVGYHVFNVTAGPIFGNHDIVRVAYGISRLLLMSSSGKVLSVSPAIGYNVAQVLLTWTENRWYVQDISR